jgi:signal transduction histidine kinase/ligand-binding sensor domain-containing protein/DNA-binding response OmpR family regulator
MRSKFAFIYNLFCIVALALCGHLHAQEHPITFKHLSYKDGLIQSPIATILQDRNGYVWIGNWSGLSRYDGTSFKNFRKNDTTEINISHSRINRVFEDRKGKLWIGTGGGLNLYDTKTESFHHVSILPGKGGGNYIATLQDDSFGNLWVSTFKGLKVVNAGTEQLEPVPLWEKQKEDELFQGISFSLFEDAQKTVWVGIKQGLKRFDPQSKKVLPLPEVLKTNQRLAASKIVVIKQDPAGDIWFGTEEDGLFRFNEKNSTCIQYLYQENDLSGLPSNWINDMLIKEHKVWIATRNGLAIFDIDQNTFANYKHDSTDPKSIDDNSVWSIMQDKTGNVWIGSYAGGINIYYPGISNFLIIGEQVGNNVGLNKPLANAIVEDHEDGLWVGTFGGGLNYINRRKGIARYYSVKDVKKGKLSNEVKAIVKDRTGKLWLGTLDGLCIFDPASETIRYINLEILNGKTGTKLINALLVDEEGIWVGTNGGGLRLVTFDGKESLSFISTPDQNDGLSDNYINALCGDGDNIWIATQNGLNKYNKATHSFTVYRRKNRTGLANNNVLTLYKDSKYRLWVGTDGGGLNCLDSSTGEIYTVNQSNGLVDDVIASIVEDRQGSLWVSTNNGLSQISFYKNTFPLKGTDYKIVNYTSGNGLSGNQFLVNAGAKTSKGEILFGGMNGVTTFFPDRIIKNTNAPEILFTGFAIKNKEVSFGHNLPLNAPVNETSHINLSYADNNITIRFSALNFIHPEKNVYAYKMSGLPENDEWIEIGNQKEVSFINLDPGRYVFNVRAANNDGVWNETGRVLTIIISPPLWRTWWAYLVYAITIALIAYKIIDFFRIRAKLERELYNEHLQNERQEEFYKMRLDFFTNISHEIRTPLTLILGPIENLYHKTQGDSRVNRQVLQIKNNAERLLRLIGELMDFRKAETGNMVLHLQRSNLVPFANEIFLSFKPLAENRSIVYEFISREEEIILNADLNQLEKVFFNLLSNAFKFTPDHGKISVEIFRDSDNYTTIKITDNGRGIPAQHHDKLFTNFYQVEPDQSQPGTGVGLALSKSIVKLHHGIISLQSQPSVAGKEGKTVFTVKLPMVSVPDDVVIINDPEDEVVVAESIQAGITERSSSETTNKRYSVLLAEDNDELRNFIAESLPDYRIVACINGSDAYENAINDIPDLVISDVMMPVMDGLELCRKIKLDERTSHIPVILLTALGTHVHQESGLQTGADVYMTKPFSTRLLELNVQNLLASRELMRKKFAQQIVLQPKNLPISSPDEGFIRKLMEIVETRMENPEFGVVELGTEIGMSKTVLYKKVCALTDLSPADFIKSMRLKKAALLVQQNTLNVNEIAVLVGFNDAKYFSKEFKKFHGKSPTELSF